MENEKTFWVGLFAFLVVLVNAAVSVWNNRRLSNVAAAIVKVDAKQMEAHQQTNSRLTELIAAEKRASTAEGVAAGREAEKQELSSQLGP